MPFYYLSFCDVTRPKGAQFLGGTLVEAEDKQAAVQLTVLNKTNPGGEISISELDISNVNELPPEGQRYLNQFIPREEVLSEPHIGGKYDLASGGVHQDCNPVKRTS